MREMWRPALQPRTLPINHQALAWKILSRCLLRAFEVRHMHIQRICDFITFFKRCGVYGLVNGRFICWNHSYRRESLKLSLKILMGLLRNGWKFVRSQGSTSTYRQRERSLTISWIEQLSPLYIIQWSTISCLWRLHSLSAARNPPPFYGSQVRITVFTRTHR